MYATVEDTFHVLGDLPEGNLLEFGVFSGNTLNRLIKGAESKGKPFQEVYGFDSWVGLPEEAEGIWHNPEWPKGAFNVCHDFKLNGPEQAMEFVRSRVERKDINLVNGFFTESLTDALGIKLKNSASYIHCDVDIYLSSLQCMEWIWKHGIAKPGCLIRYDDWCSTPDGAGQKLAHQQLQQKYHLNFVQAAENIFCFKG